MVWIHTSKKKIEKLIDDTDCKKQYIFIRPFGLWLALGSAWLDWMNSEMPEWKKAVKHVYKFNFKKDINVIKISTFDELVKFHDKYVVKTFSHEYNGEKFFDYFIDWPRVCKDYDGIIFSNYNKIKSYIYDLKQNEIMLKIPTFRSKSHHIYNWFGFIDIDSACIWKPSAVISSFEEIDIKI